MKAAGSRLPYRLLPGKGTGAPGATDVYKRQVLMRSEKVIISDPEGDIVAGTLIVVIAACYAVGGFERTVETLDHLFERAELFGRCV